MQGCYAKHAHVRIQADIGAGDMIHGVDGIDPERRQRLIDLLDIDLSWRLNRVSDGQRRRVQICMGLLKPYKVGLPLAHVSLACPAHASVAGGLLIASTTC